MSTCVCERRATDLRWFFELVMLRLLRSASCTFRLPYRTNPIAVASSGTSMRGVSFFSHATADSDTVHVSRGSIG